MIVLVEAIIALNSTAEAKGEPPLPCGLRWGDARARCAEALSAEGYSVFVRKEDYDPARSPDRMLKRIHEARGVRAQSFKKTAQNIVETVTVNFYYDELFQISIAYDNTEKGFADKIVRDISQRVSLTPRYIEGMSSKMDIYVWTFPTTTIVFSCRYGVTTPIPFAALEYRNDPILKKLKDKGLM